MSEYMDYAEYYDYDTKLIEDIPFYMKYAGQTGSPILELGCGTGRLLLPLAKSGYTIHGIDSSEKMIAVAKQKIEQTDLCERISITNANMIDFDLGEKSFALAIMAYRTFMYLLTQEEQIKCLSCVIQHLRPGGLLIIDVYSPVLSFLALPCEAEFKGYKEYTLPNGNRVIRKDRFIEKDFLNQINRSEMLFEEYNEKGTLVQSKVVPITMRYSFRFELQLLLKNVGFEIVSLFGDYDERSYGGTGEIIFVAKKP